MVLYQTVATFWWHSICSFVASCYTKSMKRESSEAAQSQMLAITSACPTWWGVMSSMLVRLSEVQPTAANQSSNIDSSSSSSHRHWESLSLPHFYRVLRGMPRTEEGDSTENLSTYCLKYILFLSLLGKHGLAVGTTGAGRRLSIARWPQDLRRSGGAGRAAIGWTLVWNHLWLDNQWRGE